MSSYRNHYRMVWFDRITWEPETDWVEFTHRRLAWLYGANHVTERAAMTQADIAAWNRLGSRSAA